MMGEGVSGVTVEGQRKARRIAVSLKPDDRLVTVELKDCDVLEGERIEFVEATALVEAEARERELERQRDEAVAIDQSIGRKVWDYHPPFSSRLGPGPAIDHLIESRKVLVEALNGAEDFIERVEKWAGVDPDEVHETLAAIRSALAGVVEAEPDGNEIDPVGMEIAQEIFRAEPDGRTER